MKYLHSFKVSLERAVEYYAAADIKLARLFVEAVDRARERIVRFPKAARKVKNYRAVMLERFPYSFCYAEDLDGELLAIALYHHKQKQPPTI